MASAAIADTAPTAGVPSCDSTVKAFLEAGKVTLLCSLDKEHEGDHYDDAFFQTWRDIAPKPDK